MSAHSTQVGPDDDNSRAISRVLEADRAAERAVKECERQAQEIMRAAQIQARRITQRTDARITLLHMRCSQRMAEQRRPLPTTADEASVEDAAAVDSAVLKAAVEKFAAILSGADAGDS